MAKFDIKGSVGNVISGNDNRVDQSSGGVQMFRWAMIGLVGLALIAGLAWGVNGFSFSWLGMDAGTTEPEQ